MPYTNSVRKSWFDPQLNVTIQKRPSEYQIRTQWQPLCAHIATLSQFGPWKLPLRLRRETYCHHTDNTIKKFYHWHCGKYWECTNPEPASHQVQLNLIAPTDWAPSSATAVPFQATAQVLTRIYANPSISARFTTSQSNAHHPTFRDHIRSLDHYSFRVFVFETRCGAHNLPLVLFLRRLDVAAVEKPFLSCLLLRPCFRRPRPP
jgi:hypothetical protein